jgi:hypothetical protein
VQQIQIEIVSTETREASITSTRHGISGHLIGFHLGDHEGAVTLTGNHRSPSQLTGSRARAREIIEEFAVGFRLLPVVVADAALQLALGHRRT